jgi:hypothetical protein
MSTDNSLQEALGTELFADVPETQESSGNSTRAEEQLLDNQQSNDQGASEAGNSDGAGSGSDDTLANTEQEGESKTFTEAEVSQILSGRDQQYEQLRTGVAERALQEQLANAENAEQAARDSDYQSVLEGEMTPEEAQGRVAERQTTVQRAAQQQQQQQASGQMMFEANAMGRAIAAEQLAQKFGIDGVELFNDASVQSREQMNIKAERMGLTKEKVDFEKQRTGTQSFDSSRPSGNGRNLSDMSAMDLIAEGVKDFD